MLYTCGAHFRLFLCPLLQNYSRGHTPDFYQGKTDFPRAKLSEVNSSRVLFYLGEKILKRHTTLGLQEWVKKDLVLDGFPRAKS